MVFTYLGQSCFLVETNGKKFLFDPFISGNPLAENIKVSSLEADYILVSHGHGDHVGDLVDIAKRTGALVISNFEVINWIKDKGISNVRDMNFGGKFYLDSSSWIKLIPALHSSSMPDRSYGGNPGGFLLKLPEGTFYYSGDTSLTLDMQLIPRFAVLDFAILPIGDNYTMGWEDAILAAEFLQCRKIIGVHFDTFPYIKIDHQEVKERFSAAGLLLTLPEIGKRMDI